MSDTIIGNKNLILINTATQTNTIVLMSNTITTQTVTVRDNAGLASASNSIFVSTILGCSFTTGLPGVSNLLQIQQPYGFVTMTSSPTNAWNVLNTFGFQPQETTYNIQELAVSTILFTDTTGYSNQLNISNGTLFLNNALLQGVPITSNLNTTSIQASTITVSRSGALTSNESTVRLNVSGTIETNFLTLNDQKLTTLNTLSVNINTLYRNAYAINGVGGYIEFGYSNTTTTYPLYIGSLPNISLGWWNINTIQSNGGFVSGFITLPGNQLLAKDSNLVIICSNTNTTAFPLYSNINTNNSGSTFLTASYDLISIS